MQESNNFYKELVDHMYDGVYFVDRDRKITYWNDGAERITGYKSNQVITRSCQDTLLNHVTEDGVELCKELCPLAACMVDGIPREADVFLHHADGQRVPVYVRAAPLRDSDGNIFGAVETFSKDTGASSTRHQLRELRHSLKIDPLTHIGNRRFLEGRLRGLAAEYEGQSECAGILFIDVDDFKQTDDVYGHACGDRILCLVAATMQCNLRSTDSIGRWGGDEFVVLLNDVDSFEDLRSIGEKLRTLVESSRIDPPEICPSPTISIGGTLFKQDDTPESLIRRADKLMYLSKVAGGNRMTVG